MRRRDARIHRAPLALGGSWLSSFLPEPGDWVVIHYHRPHLGTIPFRQLVLESDDEGVVTFQPRTPIGNPVVVRGETILAPGSPAIWITYPGAWHDVGLFHLPDGSRTGVYANVLTPVEFDTPTTWRTTDLYLDVWVPPHGAPELLDEEELMAALGRGEVDAGSAERARVEATRLLVAARAGHWPQSEVTDWTLGRATELHRALTR